MSYGNKDAEGDVGKGRGEGGGGSVLLLRTKVAIRDESAGLVHITQHESSSSK